MPSSMDQSRTSCLGTGTAFLSGRLIGIIAQAMFTAPTTMRPGDHKFDLIHNDLTRHYIVHVPTGYDGNTPLPVVLMLHGGGGQARGAMEETGWSVKADQENFLVVYPEGVPRDPTRRPSFATNPQRWNEGARRSIVPETQKHIDDSGFIQTLLDDLGTRLHVDPRRIYATGFSNGASMTFRLGRVLATRFAAIAPVAGSDWLDEPALARPVSLLYITGTQDPLNPMEGGDIKFGDQPAGRKPPVHASIQKWVRLLGCAPEPRVIYDQNGVLGVAYTGGRENTEVVLYTVTGMGHFWPGGMSHLPERIIGKSSNAINATEVVWEFFQRHSRPR